MGQFEVQTSEVSKTSEVFFGKLTHYQCAHCSRGDFDCPHISHFFENGRPEHFFQLDQGTGNDRPVEDAVIEGSISNLFLVSRGALGTPHLESGCLAGTMRGLVLELAGELGVATREEPLKRDDLRKAEELFVTSALAGVLPVFELEDERVGDGSPGAVTRKLQAALAGVLSREPGS